jgi:hypothetical protein
MRCPVRARDSPTTGLKPPPLVLPTPERMLRLMEFQTATGLEATHVYSD